MILKRNICVGEVSACVLRIIRIDILINAVFLLIFRILCELVKLCCIKINIVRDITRYINIDQSVLILLGVLLRCNLNTGENTDRVCR